MVMVAAATLSFFSIPKDAEAVSLNLINTWRMSDQGLIGNEVIEGPAWTQGGFLEGGINLHFGVGFGKGDQIVPFLGMGLQRQYYELDLRDGDDTFGIAMQFGIEFGGKFFFIERSKGKAPPFMMISFYKYFGVINEDGDSNENNHNQTMMSPFGFKLSFGAEYYFNDNFALGADFFGINFSMARSVHPDGSDTDDLIETRNQFSLFTGITLTYRFSFTLRASVQFEADYDYED
jgi:opacity protein-like surface antigen